MDEVNTSNEMFIQYLLGSDFEDKINWDGIDWTKQGWLIQSIISNHKKYLNKIKWNQLSYDKDNWVFRRLDNDEFQDISKVIPPKYKELIKKINPRLNEYNIQESKI